MRLDKMERSGRGGGGGGKGTGEIRRERGERWKEERGVYTVSSCNLAPVCCVP